MPEDTCDCKKLINNWLLKRKLPVICIIDGFQSKVRHAFHKRKTGKVDSTVNAWRHVRSHMDCKKLSNNWLMKRKLPVICILDGFQSKVRHAFHMLKTGKVDSTVNAWRHVRSHMNCKKTN